MSKYTTNEEESQCLPNRLGLTRPGEIAEAEFEGFLLAEIMLTETLTTATRFDCQYIRNIHKLALKELYTFAGRYRTVNMSKGGFLFPSALFIPQSMQFFEDEILKKLPDTYPDKASLAKDVAIVHGELLFIHPFREGNGRTARILANLMVRKQGYEGLRFDKIHFRDYVVAVQRVSEKIISLCKELKKLFFDFFIYPGINSLNFCFRNKNPFYTERSYHRIKDKFSFGRTYRSDKNCVFRYLFHVTNIQKIPLKTSNKQHFLSIFQLSEILNFDNNSFTICA